MTQSTSQQGGPRTGSQSVSRPSTSQVVTQAGIILVIVIVWVVLYSGFLRITGESNPTAVSGPDSDGMTVQAGTSVPVQESADVSFAADVQPILERRCVKCHGGEKTEEGLDLTTYDALMNGSWNGDVIEPGKSEDSYLVETIVAGDMPKNEPALLPAEIRTIAAWVDAGAPNK